VHDRERRRRDAHGLRDPSAARKRLGKDRLSCAERALERDHVPRLRSGADRRRSGAHSSSRTLELE
jgi:hypothetical protein